MHRIKQKVMENPSGWQVKQVMDLICKKTGVRYHEVHVRRMLHQWGMSPKVPKKRFVNTASPEEKADFKKGTGYTLTNAKGITAVQSSGGICWRQGKYNLMVSKYYS